MYSIASEVRKWLEESIEGVSGVLIMLLFLSEHFTHRFAHFVKIYQAIHLICALFCTSMKCYFKHTHAHTHTLYSLT